MAYTTPQKRQGVRSILFNKACNFLVETLEEAEKSQKARKTGVQSHPAPTTPRLSYSSSLVTSETSSATFPATIGQPSTWRKITHDVLNFSFDVPSSAERPSSVDRNAFGFFVPNTPGPTGNNMRIAVFPLYSQSAADEWIDRQRASFPNRAMLMCHHIANDRYPAISGVVQTATTHTVTLDCHRLNFVDSGSDVLYTVVLRPTIVTAMGLRIQVQGSQKTPWSAHTRNIALEIARSATLPAPATLHDSLIGVYSESDKFGMSSWYSSSVYSAKSKLWLFGDGIYILDGNDASDSVSWGSLGGRTWDRRRETGTWHAIQTISSGALGKVIMTKADDGQVKSWDYARSGSDNKIKINSMACERRVRVTEYWDIVSAHETRVGGPGTMTLSC